MVQNVNISGSYNGVFMLSNTGSDYKIIGSPYLPDDWMYGTLEMKSEIAGKMSSSSKEKARIDKYAKGNSNEKFLNSSYKGSNINLGYHQGKIGFNNSCTF